MSSMGMVIISAQQIYSLVILLVSVIVLLYAIYSFARVRLMAADIAELERLRQEGLLPVGSTLDQDYRTLSFLLDSIAPAVYMRQEIWVRFYYLCLQAARLLTSSSERVDTEMRRLVAYQSANYRIACSRLAEIRSN